TDMEVLVPPMPWMARRRPWAPKPPLHPSKILSGPCYELKNNFNNELKPESSFYRLVNTKAYYKTIMLTNQQAIIAAQTRACARLQKNRNKKTETKKQKQKNRNRKIEIQSEAKRNFGNYRKEHNEIKAPAEKPAIRKHKASG
ncbi:MAG TPA: hypothetical protein PKL57_03420, partial [Candidatus Wallbacteria bacterium]|nr:hypothetical protein [Candidatus Wallbacteria bacterium]